MCSSRKPVYLSCICVLCVWLTRSQEKEQIYTLALALSKKVVWTFFFVFSFPFCSEGCALFRESARMRLKFIAGFVKNGTDCLSVCVFVLMVENYYGYCRRKWSVWMLRIEIYFVRVYLYFGILRLSVIDEQLLRFKKKNLDKKKVHWMLSMQV